MSNIQLDYSDITDIFKEKLKIDNIVKKVSSIFLNQRYAGKINYKPYFQRNYVWDEEKATYFIESILLGTEIPPLVLFQTKDKNEVIDGRQRYETIKRFLDDKLVLKAKGLHSLKALSGKKYSQLDAETRELFEETRVRILQFNVVDEPKLDEEKEEKLGKRFLEDIIQELHLYRSMILIEQHLLMMICQNICIIKFILTMNCTIFYVKLFFPRAKKSK